MANPYYIPRQGLVEKLASVGNFSEKMQNMANRPKEMQMEQQQIDEVGRANRATEAYREKDLMARADDLKARIAESQQKIPLHKQEFTSADIMRFQMKYEAKHGKGAMPRTTKFFQKIADIPGTTKQTAFTDAAQSWPYLKTEIVTDFKDIINKKARENPAWIDTTEGQEMMSALGHVEASKDGMEFLQAPFSNTIKSMMDEEALMQAEMEKNRPSQYGQPFVNQMGDLVQQDMATGKLVKISSPPRGMSLRSDGAGGFEFYEGVGGGPGFTKKTQGDIEEKQLELGDAAVRTKAVLDGFKDEYLQVMPQARVEWSNFKQKWLSQKLSPEEQTKVDALSEWKTTAWQATNRTIKQITGAQMSENEVDRLMRELGDPGTNIFDGDAPSEFRKKLETIYKALKMGQARYHYIQKNGMSIGDIKLFNDDGTVSDEMPKLMKNMASSFSTDLAAKGVPPEQIAEQVKTMMADQFGLVQ